MRWWIPISLLLAGTAYAQEPAEEEPPAEAAESVEEPTDPSEAPADEPAAEEPTDPAEGAEEPAEAAEPTAPPAELEATPVETPAAPEPEAASEDGVTESEPVVASGSAAVATEADWAAPWSIGTAHTLPKGRVEIGIFQPLRIGVTPTLELSTHPLLDVLAPNVALKKTWTRLGTDWLLATRHSLWYPSGLLAVLAREGTGGILPEETRVPHIVMATNEVLLSAPAFSGHTFTGKAGVTVAATLGRSTLESIDLPLVYPRLAAVFAPASFVVGADLDGDLPGPFSYLVDIDLFVNTDSAAPFAVEHSGLATWHATEEFLVQVGYKLIFGSYPAGPDGFRTQWHVLPLVDLVWAF